MKIVLIDKEETLKVGGVVMYNERFAAHARKRGHEVSILRFCKKKPRQKNIFQIPYYLAEKRSFILLPKEDAFDKIRTRLKSIHPDIIYTSLGISPLDFFLPALSSELHIPLAGVWHADFNAERNSYQLLVKSFFLAYLPFCQQLDMLHVFSHKLSAFYQRRGVARDKLFVLPNGVDARVYSPGPSQFAKANGIKRGIVFVGRLTLQKNPEVLIQSFLSLHTDNDTKLVLVGFGDLEETLHENYQDSRIIFTGAIKDEQKKIDILRGCQIFVLPSRFEGMPLALLEAMSTGLACVASDAGSNTELFGNTGITVQNSKLKTVLPAILELLLNHPVFMQSLGKTARKRIGKYFQQEEIFDTLLLRLEKTVVDFKKKPKKVTLNMNSLITDKIKEIWRKAIDFNINF